MIPNTKNHSFILGLRSYTFFYFQQIYQQIMCLLVGMGEVLVVSNLLTRAKRSWVVRDRVRR